MSLCRALGALMLGLLLTGAGNGVPSLDVAPSCRGAAERTDAQGSFKACMAQEREARAAVAREWNAFRAEDRSGCLRLIRTGGVPTYTELLTCLEMRRAARHIDTPDAQLAGMHAGHERLD